MQHSAQPVRHSSIEEMDSLILSIRQAKNGMAEKHLAEEMGYKAGYFSQCRSRNTAPDKLLQRLRAEAKGLQNANNPGPAPPPATKDMTAIDKLADSVHRMVLLLEDKEKEKKALEAIQANLGQLTPDMIALTARVQQDLSSHREGLDAKLDLLLMHLSVPRNNAALPKAKQGDKHR